MKHSLLTAAALVFALALGGCASRGSSFGQGPTEVKNITSAEATTLAKQKERSARAEKLVDDQKPILKITALPGQTISFTGVATFEVYVPIDPNVVMADTQDVVSEDVLLWREARGFARETVVPLAAGAALLSDRKSARESQEEINRQNAEAAAAESAAQADMFKEILNRPATIITVPVGGSAELLR